MASNTNPAGGRGVLAVAVTALLVASTVAAGVSLAAVGTVSAQTTQVSSCTTIDEPGTYELTENITATPDDRNYCIRIAASDVTLDGNGYAIQGRNSGSIVADGDDELTNVTVRDVGVGDLGIKFDGVSNGAVANVSVAAGPVPFPGRINVTGDNNTITGVNRGTNRLIEPVSHAAQVVVTGDDNRVLDSDLAGQDDNGLELSGDRNVVRNVDVGGFNGLILTGADNRVTDSTVDSGYAAAVIVENATNATFVNNTYSASLRASGGFEVLNTTESTFADSAFGGVTATFESSDDNTIRNSTAVPVSVGADSDENTVRGNSIPRLYVGGESNLVYDNRIWGEPSASGNNTWNVSARPGENIVGGDTLGGNYYVDDEGTGYSQTCEDADGDGFCDEPLRINGSNTDYLPLAEPSNDTDQPDDGDDGNDTYYQVDFVAGQPIEELGEDGLYAEQDRLMRFAFGSAEEGVTEKDSAWANESIRSAVDYGHIVEHDDGTASVTFTVADGETVTLSLVTYSMPNETFSTDTVDQQELLNSTTETYGPGEHTITVSLPDDDSESDE